ncbi:hypothetical protein VKT23_008709 [Stygiomarasmius scandens]|uniref:Uncharacterized protein n=1 Tax=Marasmiellus scandens TaxID=2682957 RepID=A0ABR1JJG7_9AGAR
MELWVLKEVMGNEDRYRRCREILFKASEQLEECLAGYCVAKISITSWAHRSDGDDANRHYTIRAYGLAGDLVGSIHVGDELEYVLWFEERKEKKGKKAGKGKRGKKGKKGKKGNQSKAGTKFDSTKHVFVSEAFSSRSCLPLDF